MSRIGMMDTPQYKGDSLNDTGSVNLGVDGDFDAFGKNWKWDASYVWGRNYLRTNVNEFDTRRFYAAIDAVRDGAGNIVCGVTVRNPGLMPGCTPMNIFGVGSPSAASTAYVMGRSQYQAVNQMQIVAANISGDVFELPAGPVSIAFGAEARKQTLRQTSNTDPALAPLVDYTGIRGVPLTPSGGINALISNFTNIGVASGEVTVKEAYSKWPCRC
jgi:iron complex outermembrane receptor protein